MTDPTIGKVFDKLDEWKRLPNYQLERRADIFFAMFLTDVLEKHCDTEFEDLVIPEFPLRKGTLWPDKEHRQANRSVKVDYVTFTKGYKKVFFVELKTSMSSLNSGQNDYLEVAAKKEFKALVKGVDCLSKKSDQKEKYKCLQKLLSEVLIDAVEHKPQIVYILPKCENENHKAHRKYICFHEFESVVKGRGDIGKRFAQSLKDWAEVPAGSKKPC